MEEYMKLGDEDKKRVQKLCQQLFHKNYITEYIFANNDNLRKSNPDYNFIQSHFQIFEELLEATGWKLNDERDFGVIYITSDDVSARAVLDSVETAFLFAIRILYDKQRSRASSTGQVYITVRDIIEQLESLNSLTEIPKTRRKAALSTLRNKNIIYRINGDLGDLDCKIAVMPSILCVISSSRLKLFIERLAANDGETEVDEDDQA